MQASFSQSSIFQSKKFLIILGVVAAILIITLIIILSIPPQTSLEILVSPSSTTILIDGKPYHNGQYKISTGTHEVSLQNDGFISSQETINIENDTPYSIRKCLTPNDTDNWWESNYYKNNENDYNLCFEISQKNTLEKEASLYDPIFAYTPYHSYEDGFYIDPIYDDNDRLFIQITLLSCKESTRESLKLSALNYLNSHNVNLSEYEIIYTNPCN